MLRAWAPGVPGITEVLHARFTDHICPEHAHDTDHHEHGATVPAVPLLPPSVAHSGRAATDGVLHVDTGVPAVALTAAVVATPSLPAHAAHLLRRFTAAFGLPPYRYLTGRRVERARRLLLDGTPIAEVAGLVGFHDHAHLHRHFTRPVGTTSGRCAAGR